MITSNIEMRFRYSILLSIIAGFVLLVCLVAAARDGDSLRDLPKLAIERSQIAFPGGVPFHLQAKVFEATNRDNDTYKAEIEEYWAGPDKWRRTVKSAQFSETVTSSGGRMRYETVGEYSPLWLRMLVSAIFDSGAPLQGVDLTKSPDNPMAINLSAPTMQPTCRRFSYPAGIPPIQNRVFAWYCFQDGLLQSVGKPGYYADYSDYKKFGRKQVARKIREYVESGTTLEGDITELSELSGTDEPQITLGQSATEPHGTIRAVELSEKTLRDIAVKAPGITWPTIDGGKAVGVLSIYISVDRQGHVRETYPLNSDNPFMTDAARKQVMDWTFKPAINQGEQVQVEGILTFAYQTKIEPKPGKHNSH